MAENALDHLYFDYKLTGDAHLRPHQVFDDGQHTYLIYPNDGRFRELPTSPGQVNGKSELVNFRVDGSRYIVDRLFDKAVLVVGVGKKQTRVTITRRRPTPRRERRLTMVKPDENPKPSISKARVEENQDEILEAAQTDKVVRGVNGRLTPKARKLRPLAGIILIALVVLAAAYMRHGLATATIRR